MEELWNWCKQQLQNLARMVGLVEDSPYPQMAGMPGAAGAYHPAQLDAHQQAALAQMQQMHMQQQMPQQGMAHPAGQGMPPQQPGMPPYEEIKAVLTQQLDAVETMLQQSVSPEEIITMAKVRQQADLNQDGVIQGKEETQAFFQSLLQSNTHVSQMVRDVLQQVCEIGNSGAATPEQMQFLEARLEEMQSQLLYDNEQVKLEKAFVQQAEAQANNQGQISPELRQQLIQKMTGNALRQELEMLTTGIKQLGFTPKQQQDLVTMAAERLTQIHQGMAEKVLHILETNPEARQAVMNQPETGKTERLSWQDYCAAKGAVEQEATPTR